MIASETFRASWTNPDVFAMYDERRLLAAAALQKLFGSVLHEHFAAGSIVVEVGAGDGALSRYAQRDPDEYYWVETDHNPDFLAIPRKVPSRKVAAVLPELPFGNESIDSIVGLGVWDTLSSYDLRMAAGVARDILKPGGKALHLLDMSPDYIAEIRNARERKLFPLVNKGPEEEDPMGLVFVALKNLPRRISRLPVEQSLRSVFGAIVQDPEKYVPMANRTGILQYLGMVAKKYGMVVEEHDSWYGHMGERFAEAFSDEYEVAQNGLVTAVCEVDASGVPADLIKKGVTHITRAHGFVTASSATNGEPHSGTVKVSADAHIFAARKI